MATGSVSLGSTNGQARSIKAVGFVGWGSAEKPKAVRNTRIFVI
ncbi:hypothetical protein HMPREF9948_1110 [Propionibacterium sp. 434-HC2]|nr:hypothetical protein PAZ_c05310 [Cutibacterium acnes 266]EFD03710.1 hypothetical protein HMPREF1034_2174 [Cutibacterium acnes SK187]EFD06589.1 hypothetical protein HMPREF9207_2418 [Cutibacterium acnes J165]EGL44192.1 hypothetical protein HMPREF9948_1110 [Propionibacterium sp. 434-HC2]EGL45963.1 hypothetical protein HMPREF9947_0974 [Propionibacterium sp. 409-HC1]